MSIVAQNNNNEKMVPTKIENFFSIFKIGKALRDCNAYKEKGIPVIAVIKFLFSLVFNNTSMYMSLKMDQKTVGFGKDTVYRLQNSIRINWERLTAMVSSNIINDFMKPLISEKHTTALVIDDSSFERGRSKNVELLAKLFDHAEGRFTLGFRMLTLGWTDGVSFTPVTMSLVSSENEKSRINEAKNVDKNSTGYKRRVQAQKKATEIVPELLQTAKDQHIQADYVLFDTWFSSPKVVVSVKDKGYDVVAMVKKSPKIYYTYKGEELSVKDIYKKNKKRRGRSKYLLSVKVDLHSGDTIIPSKLVYVRNRKKRKEYLVLLCTNPALSEEEVIQTYGLRWEIEVFFKSCKSVLRLVKECRSISYDAMCAHVAIVFLRYMFLAVEARQDQDQRTMGPIFFLIQEELKAASYAEVFENIQKLFIQATETFNLPKDEITRLHEAFCALLPAEIAKTLNLRAA